MSHTISVKGVLIELDDQPELVDQDDLPVVSRHADRRPAGWSSEKHRAKTRAALIQAARETKP